MQRKFYLSDSFENSGLWWLPNEPQNKISGQLTYDPDIGIRLKLIGSFTSDDDRINGFSQDFEIVLGLTVEGRKCTLLGCQELSWRGFDTNLKTQTFLGQYVLLDGHFHSLEEINFISYSMTFDNLDEWVGVSPFNIRSRKQDGKFIGYDVEFTRVKFAEFEIDSDDFTLSISSSFWSESPSRFKSMALVNEPYLLLRSNFPRSFEWYRKIFVDLERFLILLMGDFTRAQRILAYLPANEGMEAKIEILTGSSSAKRKAPQLYRHQMIAPLNIIEPSVNDIFKQWFEYVDKLRSTTDMYFAYIYDSNTYVESKFLYLMRSLESYHRSTHSGRYLSESKYKTVYDALVNAIPEHVENDLRSALRSKFKYGNEYSLRKRIKEIFNGLSPDLASLVTNNTQQFRDQIVNWRNDLTHYDIYTGQKKMDYRALSEASRRLCTLMTILLLQSVGLEDEMIYQRLVNHRMVNQYSK